MPVLPLVKSLFRNLLRKPRIEKDLDDEIESHLDLLTDQKIEEGMSPKDARRAARIELGGIEHVKENVRAVRVGIWIESFWRDVRFGVRMLRKNPGFTAVVILTLAFGIGANTAIFSVVNAILLKPFAFLDPGQVVMFQNTFGTGQSGSASPTEFNWWREEAKSFQDVSAYDFSVANLADEPLGEQIPLMRVSANFFRLFGSSAEYGRSFTDEDDAPNGSKKAVLSHDFWQRHFGGDAQIIGRHLTLNGQPYEIIGVLSPRLEKGQIAERSSLSGDIEIYDAPDVYVALQLDRFSTDHGHYLNVIGRLRPSATLAVANAQLQASHEEYVRRWGDDSYPGENFRAQPLHDAIVGGVRSSLVVLTAAVGFVLLIACANVANLLLARANAREQEIAIRTALGAGRGRIMRQLVTESLVISSAGGVLGLVTGFAGIQALLRLIAGTIPRIGPVGSHASLDSRVLAFTIGLSALTGILFGLAPAFHSSRPDFGRQIDENSRVLALRRLNSRALLLIAETALAVVLLIGAALLLRSFVAIRQVNPGFDARNILTMRMSFVGPQFSEPATATEVIREGTRRIRALPGVEEAASTCCLPFEDRLHGAFQIGGRTPGPNSQGTMGWTVITPGYFETFKIPVLRGRAFTERDQSGPPVAIINQTLANQFWQNSDPLNDEITMGGESVPRKIVGIVGDVREEALDHNPRPNVYLLPTQTSKSDLMTNWAWVIRTRPSPTSLTSAIRRELHEASGGLPVGQVRTMEQILWRSTASTNFSTLMLVIFGGSALLLAAIGVYGVTAYSVAQRIREIGIRLALGEDRNHLKRMLVLQSMQFVLIGVALGVVTATGLKGFISSLLFGVQPWNIAIYVSVPILMTATAIIGAYLPVRRVLKISPAQAIHCE